MPELSVFSFLPNIFEIQPILSLSLQLINVFTCKDNVFSFTTVQKNEISFHKIFVFHNFPRFSCFFAFAVKRPKRRAATPSKPPLKSLLPAIATSFVRHRKTGNLRARIYNKECAQEKFRVIFQNECGRFGKRLRWFCKTTAVVSATLPAKFFAEKRKIISVAQKGCILRQ